MTQIDYDRARLGDEAAWTRIFHACYPRLVRLVGEDAANDAFAKLVEDPPDIQTFDELVAWLEAEVQRSGTSG